MHRLVSQAGAQALAQLLPGQGLLGALVEQFAVLRHEARQILGHQAHATHRRGHLDLLQAPARQFEQHPRLALGAEQADLDQGVGPLDMFQVQLEALHPAVTATEKRRQIAGQAAQGNSRA